MTIPKVLFVCLGNICRSPTAEAVFRKLAADAGLNIEIDSAGTGGWHHGDPPDPRAVAAATRRGYDFKGQSARRVEPEDFARFDHIFVMDQNNLRDLKARCPTEHIEKIQLFLSLAPDAGTTDVPDPYYGGEDGFNDVLNLIELASQKLIITLNT